MRPNVIILHPDDNVATAVEDLAAGDIVSIKGTELKVVEPIPYGHKIALTDIAKGETILKYGEPIGRARDDIAAGGYVHVHNIDSQRGRGDRPGEAVK